MEKDSQTVRMLRLEKSREVNWTECSCGSLFQCLCCKQPGQSSEDKKFDAISMQLTDLRQQLIQMTKRQPAVDDGG